MTTTYNVYQDGVLVDNVPDVPAFDRVVGLADATTYLFQIGQVIDGTEVLRSNIVSVTTLPAGTVDPPPPDPDPDPPPGGPGGPGDPGFTTLQAAVTAASAGATITCPENSTFNEFVTIPSGKDGLTIEFNGSAIDGQNIRKQWMIVGSDNVTLQNFTMRNAKSADGLPSGEFQLASLSASGTTGLTLANGRLTGGAADNFGMQGGSNLTILNCEIDNARVTGLSFGIVSTVLIDGCHIHHNNPNDLGDAGNEAGGLKCGNGGASIVISNNEFDHNHGPGIWFDVNAKGVTTNNNRVHHNHGPGIFFEVSGYSSDAGGFAAASRIHHNSVWENGWGSVADWTTGAILISSAANVEVDHNTSAWNRHALVVYGQHRLIGPANTHNYDVKSVNVHDNTFVLGTRTLIGGEYPALQWWGQDFAGPMYTNPGNVGANNAHWSYLGDGAYGTFQWNNSGSYTMAAFNATAVGGGNSTRITSGARDTALTAAGIPLAPEAH